MNTIQCRIYTHYIPIVLEDTNFFLRFCVKNKLLQFEIGLAIPYSMKYPGYVSDLKYFVIIAIFLSTMGRYQLVDTVFKKITKDIFLIFFMRQELYNFYSI